MTLREEKKLINTLSRQYRIACNKGECPFPEECPLRRVIPCHEVKDVDWQAYYRRQIDLPKKWSVEMKANECFERVLDLQNCPVHPMVVLEEARKATEGSGLYFTLRCLSVCKRFTNCPWLMLNWGEGDKPHSPEENDA